jgi:hypothetical protein
MGYKAVRGRDGGTETRRIMEAIFRLVAPLSRLRVRNTPTTVETNMILGGAYEVIRSVA